MEKTLQYCRRGSWKNVAAQPGGTIAERLSECFWFLLSLVLFVILGPFSGPVALIVLFKLGLEESVQAEPESIITR
jgi:hypothetical protein